MCFIFNLLQPITLARIEELSDAKVTKEDEISSAVEIFMKDPDRPVSQFILILVNR